MRIKKLAYIKTVRARGHTYLYFDTGTKDDRGKIIYNRLPNKDDPRFGSVYAAMLGHRTRRAVGVLTVPKLVAMYQASPQFEKLSASSQKLYKIYQRKFAEQLPTAPAGEVSQSDMLLLFDKMATTPGAANIMLGCVGAMYKWARERGHVANRPTDDIIGNDLGEHEPWPEGLLFEALACDDRVVRLAVHLLYYTAQRIGDVCAMRWQQIGDGVTRVRQQKTGKELAIAMHPILEKELSRLPRDLRTILADDAGKPFTTNRLRLLLQAWAKGRGHKIVPHGIRKNAVNSLLECGCTVAETAAISGQTIQVVEHYAKKRDQTKLAKAAIYKWGGTESEPGNNRKT